MGSKSKTSSCKQIIRFHAWGLAEEGTGSAGPSPASASGSKVQHLGPGSSLLVVPVAPTGGFLGPYPISQWGHALAGLPRLQFGICGRQGECSLRTARD